MAKKIFKTMNGIRYYSVKVMDGYRFWESVSHPSYSHFKKV